MRARQTTEERFTGIFDAHYRRLYLFALRHCGDRAAADDVAAEVFTSAWRNLDELPRDPLPWLYATARGVLANERRGRRRSEALAERVRNEAGVSAQPTEPVDHELLTALASLDERDREALLLTAWEGLDRRRAARVTGCSMPAFAARLRRARKRLAAALVDAARSAHPVAAETRTSEAHPVREMS